MTPQKQENQSIEKKIKEEKIDLGFYHIFKCGGTTINWILQKNCPDKCLYIESKTGKRLSIDDMSRTIREIIPEDIKAISSHNIDEECILRTKFPFTFIRDPLERMWSAYKFEKFQQKINPDEMILEFCSKNKNFQARVLGGENKDPEEICNKFNIGILDRFDDSLIGLERVLRTKGLKYDLSYDLAKNTNISKKKLEKKDIRLIEDQKQILDTHREDLARENDKDYMLLMLAKAKLEGILSTLKDKEHSRIEFKDRCLLLRKEGIKIKSYGQGPQHFTFT